MKLHALVRISVDLDDVDAEGFQDSVARMMSRGDEPDEFQLACTATPENALAVLFGSKMHEDVQAVLGRATGLRYNAVYCSPDEVRREPDQPAASAHRKGSPPA